MSGGLDLLARKVCEATGIDMYVANGLRLKPTGHLAGEGICFVRINDKGSPTRELLAKLGVRPERAAAVGNSEWDVPMFRAVGLGVAYNPSDDAVRAGAHAVVEKGDMRDVLPHLLAYRAPAGPR
jgi:phosphoserine phosphatase